MIEITNQPAPVMPEKYIRELIDIGGLNIYGAPNLIFEWGQTSLTWFRGKWRVKYRDMTVPAQKHVRFTRQKIGRKDVELKVYPTLDEALNDDWGIFSLQIAYEHIGKPLWYVSRWHPPEEKGDVETWEKLRWQKATDSELGYMPNCDMLGEFPTRGFYEDMMVVGEFTGDRLPSGQGILRYRSIDDEVMNDVRKLWHERQHASKFNATQFIQEWYDREGAEEQKSEDEEHYRRMDIAKTAYHMAAKDRVFVGGK